MDFKPCSDKTYVTKDFTMGTFASFRIGTVKIPVDETKARVVSTGLIIYEYDK